MWLFKHIFQEDFSLYFWQEECGWEIPRRIFLKAVYLNSHRDSIAAAAAAIVIVAFLGLSFWHIIYLSDNGNQVQSEKTAVMWKERVKCTLVVCQKKKRRRQSKTEEEERGVEGEKKRRDKYEFANKLCIPGSFRQVLQSTEWEYLRIPVCGQPAHWHCAETQAVTHRIIPLSSVSRMCMCYFKHS